MKYFAAALIALLSLMPCAAQAQAFSPQGAPNASVAVNISTVTTTTLVAPIANEAIFVFGYNLYVQGTTPTFQFAYGTGTAGACTSTSPLTGAMGELGGTTAIYNMSVGPFWIFRAPQGAALCVISTGTTPAIQGVLTYGQY